MKKTVRILAAVLAIGMAAACTGCGGGNSAGGDSKEVVWCLPVGTSQDEAAVHEKVNEYVKEKLGVDLRIDTIDSGSYEQKMQMMNASNEDYDICFTSNWLNNYYTNIENDIFLPIGELMKKETPALYGLFNEKMWDGVKVDGEIYGIMNQQIFAWAPALLFPEKNLEATGFTIDDFSDLKDLTPYLEKVVELTGKPVRVPTTWKAHTLKAGIEHIAGDDVPVGIYTADTGLKVFNVFESPEFKDYAKLVYDWRIAGLQHEDIIFKDGNEVKATIDSAVTEFAFEYPNTDKPGYAESLTEEYGTTMVVKRIAKPYLTSSGVTATLQAINSNSEKPIDALKVLELVNTDKYLYNLLVYGIEGRNYTKIGENKIEKSKDNVYGVSDWAMGNTFLGYTTENVPDNVHEQTHEINSTAEFSPAYGFVADLSEFGVQVSNCKSVISEYLSGLEQGVADYNTVYEQFVQKLKAAGADILVEEVQKQIDEWKKN